ncbi:MAG: hypothetical protein AAGD13_05345 [Pseudomonadota bacterium]
MKKTDAAQELEDDLLDAASGGSGVGIAISSAPTLRASVEPVRPPDEVGSTDVLSKEVSLDLFNLPGKEVSLDLPEDDGLITVCLPFDTPMKKP